MRVARAEVDNYLKIRCPYCKNLKTEGFGESGDSCPESLSGYTGDEYEHEEIRK